MVAIPVMAITLTCFSLYSVLFHRSLLAATYLLLVVCVLLSFAGRWASIVFRRVIFFPCCWLLAIACVRVLVAPRSAMSADIVIPTL